MSDCRSFHRLVSRSPGRKKPEIDIVARSPSCIWTRWEHSKGVFHVLYGSEFIGLVRLRWNRGSVSLVPCDSADDLFIDQMTRRYTISSFGDLSTKGREELFSTNSFFRDIDQISDLHQGRIAFWGHLTTLVCIMRSPKLGIFMIFLTTYFNLNLCLILYILEETKICVEV